MTTDPATNDETSHLAGTTVRATIDVMILIDTTSLPTAGSDSSSTEEPAVCERDAAFMIAGLAHVADGNGTADLHLRSSGDVLRLWAISLSNQLGDEVFVYDLEHLDGNRVLGSKRLCNHTVTANAMVPQPQRYDHSPPACESLETIFHYTTVTTTGHGTEKLAIKFLVYGPPDADGNRSVKGYYRWEPSFTISRPPTD